jgi:hypothetical protein
MSTPYMGTYINKKMNAMPGRISNCKSHWSHIRLRTWCCLLCVNAGADIATAPYHLQLQLFYSACNTFGKMLH